MQVNKIKISYDNNIVLNNISFTLSNIDKVGLVGPNGAGKSTLLKAISGNLEIDSGKINFDNETVGYLKQEINFSDYELTILEYIKLYTGYTKLETKLHELENNLSDVNMEEYSNVLEKFLQIDGYNFEDNIKMILSGLKFNKNLENKIEILSGGEKIKILLGTLLLENKDILLLDEPTNNLDLNAIEWLENYLKQTKKKMLIISHDETFLNNITNKVMELNEGTIREYNLSYFAYLEQKKIEYRIKKEEYDKAMQEKDKIKKQIQTAKEWANKGVSSKAHNDNDKLANNYAKERTNTKDVSRLNRSLEKINIPDFREKEKINFSFIFNDCKGNKDIRLENLVCGYSNFNIAMIDMDIPFGSRVNIIGGNGTGKSTLLKTILGYIKPIKGNVAIGNNANIGYISQNTIIGDANDTIFEYLTKNKDIYDKSQIFVLLDKFNINYDDRNKTYSLLSPGERTRVNLVKIALEKINVLILDEVTNHLDKEGIDLIYELIDNYEGTIISVSHNRLYNEKLNANYELNIENGFVKQKKLTKLK